MRRVSKEGRREGGRGRASRKTAWDCLGTSCSTAGDMGTSAPSLSCIRLQASEEKPHVGWVKLCLLSRNLAFIGKEKGLAACGSWSLRDVWSTPLAGSALRNPKNLHLPRIFFAGQFRELLPWNRRLVANGTR